MMIKAPLGLSLLRNRSILTSEENKKTNPSPVEKRFGSSWFDTKKKRHTNACSPVDIPTGWEPRTKQQPTGLLLTLLRRAVLFKSSYPHKKRKDIRTYVFSWCSYAIKIRTISLCFGFLYFFKRNGLCTLFIVKRKYAGSKSVDGKPVRTAGCQSCAVQS